MGFPGPNGVVWGLELVVWALAAIVLGEFVRVGVGRWVGLWRRLEPIERGLLDLYLGGAVVYLCAALPVGAFGRALGIALPVAGALGLIVLVATRRGEGRASDLGADLARLARPGPLAVLVSFLALFVFELALALPVASGNTYDSSLLTLYTSLLIQHGTLPVSFAPYASQAILYPQGTTAWLGWGQVVFGLPPPRTALLVTPLFLALAPLGGFVLGQRWFGSERAGAAVALLLAWIGPGSRTIVGASNDLVFAFPLVLLLAGEAVVWLRTSPPGVPDALAWGLALGYSAALNPVGAELLAPAVLLAGLLARPRFGGTLRAWLVRWVAAVGVALIAVAPSLAVLAEGWGGPGLVRGQAVPPPGSTAGFTIADWIGRIDPYLFRPGDTAISPVPLLTVEFAVLFTVGLAILLFTGRQSPLGRYLETGRILLASLAAVAIVYLTIFALTPTGFRPAIDLAELSNANEISTWLFTVYSIAAALPLALLLERWAAPPHRPREAGANAPAAPARSWALGGRSRSRNATIALALAALVVVPGATLTLTGFPPVVSKLYLDYGNLTADDFQMLEYAGAHLPSGARVLVAPGSSAEFLPGYDRDVVLLYPLVPGWPWINGSYRLVVSELTNGTLNSSGVAALASLDVGFILVTGWNTVLWPPFSPVPLLEDPGTFPLLQEFGDAYLFGFAAPEG